MGRLRVFLAILIPLVLLACGGGAAEVAETYSDDFSLTKMNDSSEELMVMASPTGTPAPAAAFAAEISEEALEMRDGGSLRIAGALETAQRKVISSAFIAIELEGVPDATSQVRVIAESLGGFVEQLSSSGRPERRRATMTIRVPQDQFPQALERIEALGTVLSRDIGSEDVSEEFIDIEARLKNALGEEQSLLALLERARAVSDVLAIERELFRVRSEIERYQGRLNFLERRVELATITVSLVSPAVNVGEPPSASLSIEVFEVSGTLARVKGLAEGLGGVVDGVFVSQRNGTEEAAFFLRVVPRDFQQGIDFLETQGKVRSKEVREGTPPTGGSIEDVEGLDSAIYVTLAKAPGSDNAWLIAAIAGPLGGITLAAALGFLFFWVYRAGRNRGR